MTENPSTQAPEAGPTTPSTDPRAVVVPERPALEGLEEKWSRAWADNDTYAFDRTQPRENVYSISHTDLIARYQRMQGKAVFYPIGWDDNGLPTERRVQNYFGVRCDPSLPYEADFTPPEKPDP